MRRKKLVSLSLVTQGRRKSMNFSWNVAHTWSEMEPASGHADPLDGSVLFVNFAGLADYRQAGGQHA